MCHTLNNFFFPRPLLYVGIESAGYPALDCTLHPAAPRGACHLRRRGCQVPSPRVARWLARVAARPHNHFTHCERLMDPRPAAPRMPPSRGQRDPSKDLGRRR